MIRVSGTARIRVDYTVELDMTEAEFDALPGKRQDEIIDNAVDWLDACRSGELDDLDVDELDEIDESA